MPPLRAIAPDLWIADGPPVNVLGPITMPTRMMLVRLRDGTMWINSPVEASLEQMQSVAELGEIAHLVAPTKLHLWRLAAWAMAFPRALLWGPPGAERAQNAALAGVLGDVPPAAWSAELDQCVVRGNVLIEEVEFFHASSRSLIFADFFQNYPPMQRQPWRNAALRTAGVLGGGVPRDIRSMFLRCRVARESLRKILTWDFDRLIPAHGDCVDRGAHRVVERAFGWL